LAATKNVKKLEIKLPASIESLMIGVAMKEHGGNLSNYVRELIYADLLRRNCIDTPTANVLKDLAI
jgi:hypothetical protein